MQNLEALAALAANDMAGTEPSQATDAENIITKALAVLAEQGLYAFGLFLATRKRKQDITPAQRIHETVRSLLQQTKLATSAQNQAPNLPMLYRSLTTAQQGESATDALRRMLLTKQLLETTLTYARYAAKALKVGDEA